MGSHYRERHTITNTTTDDLAGLTGTPAQPEAEDVDEDLSLAELRDKATELELPTYGTKADLRERIAQHEADS